MGMNNPKDLLQMCFLKDVEHWAASDKKFRATNGETASNSSVLTFN